MTSELSPIERFTVKYYDTDARCVRWKSFADLSEAGTFAASHRIYGKLAQVWDLSVDYIATPREKAD